ncbi:hypothetical protein D477_018294 [Arthrobacter crystallopoietes BAB-32]|uniref:Uncharacterized protein n=1 Tax=Arthrobacter crystallopoietes BAB-32 TaxID=1246476 RepID=N1UQY5_9MICC|nr:alkaline phosphatase D family protein [Arthrobacter crystallopoietes]EMY32801.1 hypothetical protein D477_018294 [Arthrobacter crystallopoietes BAB-32]
MGKPALVLGPMMRHVDQSSANIWVETGSAARVVVRAGTRSWEARTFAVHGHHYALVEADGLEPGSTTPYQVEIDGAPVWPDPDSPFPAPVIATLAPERPLRLVFGSCRTSIDHGRSGNRTHGVDSLRAFALQLARKPERRPDLALFLGDQVYADSTTKEMQKFIRARRDLKEPPGKELKDFEEYAELYRLAWSDEANRWLFSTVPSAMIFDDHDVRDDWNASRSWKRKMEATSWWHERIVAGLASYWVYQHLGNLSPEQRAQDPLWQKIAAHQDGAELDLSADLDAFAERADKEPRSYRWSYCQDFGSTRLIVIDSRAARDLDPDRRALVDDDEMAWFDERLRGGFRQLLIGTSLPFLLPTGLHHVESWNEAMSEGAWGRFASAVGERLRQAIDLEHWAAFQNSFRKVAGMVQEVADGRRGPAPELIVFLSGDVHYSYASEVERSTGSRIVQAVCSPVRNPLPLAMRSFTAVMSYGIATPVGALAARSIKVPDPPFEWKNIKGPWFDNNLATLEDTQSGLSIRWETGEVDHRDYQHPRVREVSAVLLEPRGSAGMQPADLSHADPAERHTPPI